MKANTIKANGVKVESRSFQSILNEMKKLTDGGNIKVANKHWNIHKRVVNNVDYGSPLGA
jgi:hypothetical protein